jgi:small-conductance mechanosensitive channel
VTEEVVTIEQAMAMLRTASDEVDLAEREDTALRNRLSRLRAEEDAARKELARTVVRRLGGHDAVSVLHALAVELKRELVDPVEPHPSKVKAMLVSLVALINQHEENVPSVITDRVEQIEKELKL